MSLSPWHGGVLTAAALVSAPATWSAFVTGSLPVADALTRFLLCVGLCWVALNVSLPLLVPARATLEPATATAEGPGTAEPPGTTTGEVP